MKNKHVSFLLAICLCGSSLIAQGIQQPKDYNLQPAMLESTAALTTAASQITAGKYCTFLNAVAVSDPHHLYDEKMTADLEGGCILRSGVVGSYSYSVIKGKENNPIPFLSWLDAMRYCNWLENGYATSFVSSENIDGATEHGSYELQEDQLILINPDAIYLVEHDSEYDPELGLSSFNFQIINTSLPSSLAKISSGGSGKDTSWEEKVVGITAGVGMILGGGGEEHVDEGGVTSDAARGIASGLAEEGGDESSLTLYHFRTALAANPTATRFVIVEDEENEGALSIQPRAAETGRFGPSRSENINIIDRLRGLLLVKHNGNAEIVRNLLNENNSLSMERAPLSAERLRMLLSAERLGSILTRSDAAEQHVSDHVDLDEDYLNLTWREAEESADHSISKQEWIKTRIAAGKLSPQLQSRAESAAKHNRDEWQQTRNRYSKFLEETGEEAISEAMQQQISSLIIASNEALKAAQEILDLLSPSDTSRAPEIDDSGARVASPQTTRLQAELNDYIQDTHATAVEAIRERNGLPRDEKDKLKVIDPSEENRRKVMTALKSYEEKLQQWRSDEEGKGVGKISSIKNATKAITAKLIDSLTDPSLTDPPLDFSTPKDKAVFWTGYKERNQDTAMSYAKDQGKQTLEMTPGGSLLDGLGFFKDGSDIATKVTDKDGKVSYPSKLGDALFETASTKFAENARGDATAVIIEGRYPTSVYSRIERPILKRKEKETDPEKLVKLEELKVPVKIAGLFWQQLDSQKEIDATQINKLKQQAAEAHKKADAAYAAGKEGPSWDLDKKTREGEGWKNLENSLRGVVDKSEKAIKAKEAGKTEEAKDWGEIAALQERAIEPHTQAAKKYDNHLNKSGLAFYNSAEKRGKAVEAKVAGKSAEAAGKTAQAAGKLVEAAEKTAEAAKKLAEAAKWREAAELNLRSGELYNQAVRANIECEMTQGQSIGAITNRMIKKEEITSCDGAGANFDNAAEKLENAIAAEAAGKLTDAQKWNEAAAFYRQSGELYIKAIPNQHDCGSDHRYDPFQTKAAIRATQIYKACTYQEAAEERVKGNTQAVEAYLNSIKADKDRAAALTQGDQAAAEMHEKTGMTQFKIGTTQSHAILSYERAAKQQAEGNSQTAEAYREQAKAYEAQAAALAQGDQAAAERHQKAAEVFGKLQEKEVYWEIQDNFSQNVVVGSGVVGAYKKAAIQEAKRNSQTAEAYRKQAKAYEAQAAALAQGDQAAAERHQKAAEVFGGSPDFLFNSKEGAAQAYERAVKEHVKGNTQVADLYRKSAQAYEAQAEALANENKVVAEIYEKVARVYANATLPHDKAVVSIKTTREREEEPLRLNNVDDYASRSVRVVEEVVKTLEKVALATSEGKIELAECWNKIEQQYQILFEYRRQTSEAYARGDKSEAERLKTLGAAIIEKIEQFKKTATALEEATKK